MKRDKFLITHEGKQVAIKFAWNSAWHGIATLVRPIALAELQTYTLIEKEVRRDLDGHFYGFQIWQGEQTAKTVKFEITKLKA